jgi:hypothetical protein
LQNELANLIAAIVSTGHTPSIAEAIGERERELRTITQKLPGSQRDAVSPRLSEIRDFVIDRLTNIRALVNSDIKRARVELAKRITCIRSSRFTTTTKRPGSGTCWGSNRLYAKERRCAIGWLRGTAINTK